MKGSISINFLEKKYNDKQCFHLSTPLAKFTLFIKRPLFSASHINKSWRQHPTKQQLYGHLPPIIKTIQIRQTRHAGHCWRRKDKLISDVLLWNPAHRWAKVGQPAITYIQQLCAYIRCSLEDLLVVMNDRDRWRERVREIRASSTSW